MKIIKNVTIRDINIKKWNKAMFDAKSKGVNIAEHIESLIDSYQPEPRVCGENEFRCGMCNDVFDKDKEVRVDENGEGVPMFFRYEDNDESEMRVCKECMFCLLMSGAKSIVKYKKNKGHICLRP